MSSDSPSKTNQYDFTVDATQPLALEKRKSSYSLLLLFYLTTLAAFMAAVCRLALVDTQWSGQAIYVGGLVTCCLCVAMSIVLGWLIGRTWISALLGLFAGLICGLVAWLMTLVQPTHYESAGMLLCAGCWLMSLISIAGNRWSHRT